MTGPEPKNQLSLWDKLNRLYADDTDASPESPGKEGRSAGESESQPEGTTEPLSAGKGGQAAAETPGANIKESQEADKEEGSRDTGEDDKPVSAICLECEQSCKQRGGKFVLALCPKTEKKAMEQSSHQMLPASRASGYEKINETCRRCRHSCKQTSHKLNRMLCLGFDPQPPPTG